MAIYMNYKFGKLKAKIDKRTLKLSYILQTPQLPPIPNTYEIDIDNKYDIPLNMFGNNNYNNCVIVSRANQTLRFEFKEQNKLIPITTQDCLNEYWFEEGYVENECKLLRSTIFKPNRGLIMVNSLNQWRKTGWQLEGNNYTIYAYAAVTIKDHEEVKRAIYLLGGLQAGAQITKDSMNQLNSGQTWDITPNERIVGGHAVYVVGYNATGPICITWGKKQQMTWAWWDKYMDEVFCIVDNRNNWMSNSIIDVELLDQYLHIVTDPI